MIFRRENLLQKEKKLFFSHIRIGDIVFYDKQQQNGAKITKKEKM